MKIFEGDIVIYTLQSDSSSTEAIIDWDGATAMFFVASVAKDSDGYVKKYSLFDATRRCEVIDNIHDNPALLEVNA